MTRVREGKPSHKLAALGKGRLELAQGVNVIATEPVQHTEATGSES